MEAILASFDASCHFRVLLNTWAIFGSGKQDRTIPSKGEKRYIHSHV